MLHILMGEPEFDVPAARIEDGLTERKPLKANNDRPLMQIDQRQGWSDHATIPGYEKGIPGNPSTISSKK